MCTPAWQKRPTGLSGDFRRAGSDPAPLCALRYWDDAIRPSALVDSGADLLIYGMGEKQVTEIARRLRAGEPVGSMHDIRGTLYAVPTKDTPFGGVECPSFENVCASKKEYARSCRLEQDEQDHVRGKLLKQRHGKVMVVQNPLWSR